MSSGAAEVIGDDDWHQGMNEHKQGQGMEGTNNGQGNERAQTMDKEMNKNTQNIRTEARESGDLI